MFTGIITDLGAVRAIERAGDTRFEVTTSYDTDTIDVGASIACSGVCLTVVDKGADHFAVSLVQYTQAHTNHLRRSVGERVNIETDLIARYVALAQARTGSVEPLRP